MALSSGPPPSAVAVIRVSGPEACAVATAFGVKTLLPRQAVLRGLTSPVDGSLIDRALCLYFAAPGSATGEDVLELHLHGGVAVVERVLADAVTLSGVRAAEAGEFTLRAVLNGKMGLADAEALADLIEARTEAERRRAVRLADGALSRRLADWRERLIGALALCEAHLDFADDGDVGSAQPEIDAVLEPLRSEIEVVLAGSIDAERLTDGFHVALVGPPNAGKSSLLNALCERDAAIVSPEAGTTRDVVSVTLDLDGYRVTLSDTAGVRDGVVGVEAAGIARTEAARRAADLVIEVTSPDTRPLDLPDADLRILHKKDMAAVAATADLATSLADPVSIADLREHIAAHARAGLSRAENALITRTRQRSALTDVRDGIAEALATDALELKAEGLRLACAAMARMTGEIGIEDVLDDVFGRFCIGK
ncbi:tRNA uridine-5-carboxymethylaminomethyl(34) synthesis GTPase MnmE [Acuticoccus mangrovi]|uniref:tRNA uridine-5-carboxymethylaminomethyl(34) synthesis GTPase MnmE n=1 Tax=Acuticoccus mangrovi TaxID=2796142 RepID=UPI002FC9D7A3